MAITHIDRLDDSIGTGVEHLVVAHHRRRLKRRGWEHAYDPRRDDVDGEPHEVIDRLWVATAEQGDHLAVLPHVSRRSRRLLGPINGLLVDG